jgi:hypothetical protein
MTSLEPMHEIDLHPSEWKSERKKREPFSAREPQRQLVMELAG